MEIFLASLAAILVVVFAFNRIIEPLYILVFQKPLFVHFYIFPKRLPAEQRALLAKEFTFYRKLSDGRKVYFEHRVNKFIEAYNFVGRDGLKVTREMRIKIAATSVMLTFGMRKYLYDVFTTIILYPDIYASPKDGTMHKGEFNPALKVIVFSWPDFEQGLLFDNDNLNLGLHEFAHALHFNSLRKRRAGASAAIYRDMYNEIMVYIANAEKRRRLVEQNYFRNYAFTNQLEFMAVILEYFFETPQDFKQKFPELHALVSKMINFREG
jgi:Mlc titration factor MtfA (ptsG expression regulator)